MARTKKRKAATVAGVSVLTAALLLGGTFAWQSISQTALNENRASVNPGARLHDDYSGNYAKSTAKAVSDVGVKRVYVENFTDEQDKVSVIARVRLDEYMEIGGSAGYKKESVTEHGNIVKSDDNGVVRVTEDATTDSSKVTIKIQPIPYQDTQVNTITVKVDNAVQTDPDGDGIYVYDQPVSSGTVTPVTIEVSINTTSAGTYTGDRIKKAKSLETGAGINDVKTWKTYIPKVDADGNLIENSDSAFRKYVTLNFGWDSKYDTAGIYYMPTFNKNKDSLSADINGTYAKGFTDYVTYTANQQITDDAVYDADSNNVDDANVTLKEEIHTAKAIDKTKSKVISMQKWLENPTTGDFWIYDTDGWAYWANLIAPEDATGLFLSRNEMTGKPEDNWYYGMNVVGQFVTPGDVGKGESTGFYDTDAGTVPSEDAEILLAMLGGSSEKITTEGIDQSGVLQIESGVTQTVSVAQAQTLSLTSLNTLKNGWTSTDEDVVKVTASDSNPETATITTRLPGEAWLIYKSESKMAALKVNVAYATYTITQNNMDDAQEKGIVSYTDAEKEADLVIAGYCPELDAEDYDTKDVYYQVQIGTDAFKDNTKIKSLILKEGVSEIGESAFFHCTALACDLEIPGSVKRVGHASFMGTALTGLTLDEGIEEIGYNAFRGITSLKVDICIPASMSYFRNDVFLSSPITDFTVAEGSEYYCIDNKNLYTKDKKELVWYRLNEAEFEIPEGVERIGASAFRCTKIKTLTIPKSLKTVMEAGFYEAYWLETINYKGTSDEWSLIKLENNWNYNMGYSVDGETKIVYDYVGTVGGTE